MAKPPAPYLVISNRGMKDTRGKASSIEDAEAFAQKIAERDHTTIYIFRLVSVVSAPSHTEQIEVNDDYHG